MLWTLIALLTAAAVLMLLEIFTPSFGVLAGSAVLALAGAVWTAFRISTTTGLAVLCAVIVVTPVYLVWLVRWLPKTRFGRRIFLGKVADQAAAGTPEAAEHAALVGREGVAETPLRPSGAVRIGGKRVMASAESGMIDKGEAVRVVRAGETQVIVRRVARIGGGGLSPGGGT